MPIRAVLNVTYRIATEHMDAKERQAFDDDLYGFAALNEQANRVLRGGEG